MVYPTVRTKTAASLHRVLRHADAFVERTAPVSAIGIILLFALWGWFASRANHLEFDELLELSVATATTSSGVVSTLAAGVDFNPPLSHFLVRASDSLFGDSDWALRLPAFLGLAALLVCIYRFVSGQLGRAYGLIAMLVILCMPVRDYAVEARPYGIVLGLSGLSLLLYRAATQRKRRGLALAGLALCTAALPASHYYAVLVVAVITAASLVRAWELRKPDWPLLISCTAPPITILILLRDVIAQQMHRLAHYFARGNLLSFDHGYDDLTMDPLVGCVALLLATVLIVLFPKALEATFSFKAIRDLRPDIVVLAVGLLSLPLVGAVITQFVTHAYLTRYFLPASIGCAVCLCYGLKFVSGAVPGIVLVSVLSLGLGFGKAILQQAHRSAEPMPLASALESGALPILFDNPEAYLQIYHYVPAVRRNIWVIADPAASLRYRQYDTDDRIMLALAGGGRVQAISLASAARMWPAFSLVPRSADYVWALKCVMDAGSQVAVRHSLGSSNFIFEVHVPPEKVAWIGACGRH